MKNSVMKRMLAGVLSAAMIFTSMPASFLAEEVSGTAEETVIAAEEGAAEEAAAEQTGVETDAAVYDDSSLFQDPAFETDGDTAVLADPDNEFVEAWSEDDEELVDSLDEFEEIEEFIVDEETVLEEEVFAEEEEADDWHEDEFNEAIEDLTEEAAEEEAVLADGEPDDWGQLLDEEHDRDDNGFPIRWLDEDNESDISLSIDSDRFEEDAIYEITWKLGVWQSGDVLWISSTDYADYDDIYELSEDKRTILIDPAAAEAFEVYYGRDALCVHADIEKKEEGAESKFYFAENWTHIWRHQYDIYYENIMPGEESRLLEEKIRFGKWIDGSVSNQWHTWDKYLGNVVEISDFKIIGHYRWNDDEDPNAQNDEWIQLSGEGDDIVAKVEIKDDAYEIVPVRGGKITVSFTASVHDGDDIVYTEDTTDLVYYFNDERYDFGAYFPGQVNQMLPGDTIRVDTDLRYVRKMFHDDGSSWDDWKDVSDYSIALAGDGANPGYDPDTLRDVKVKQDENSGKPYLEIISQDHEGGTWVALRITGKCPVEDREDFDFVRIIRVNVHDSYLYAQPGEGATTHVIPGTVLDTEDIDMQVFERSAGEDEDVNVTDRFAFVVDMESLDKNAWQVTEEGALPKLKRLGSWGTGFRIRSYRKDNEGQVSEEQGPEYWFGVDEFDYRMSLTGDGLPADPDEDNRAYLFDEDEFTWTIYLSGEGDDWSDIPSEELGFLWVANIDGDEMICPAGILFEDGHISVDGLTAVIRGSEELRGLLESRRTGGFNLRGYAYIKTGEQPTNLENVITLAETDNIRIEVRQTIYEPDFQNEGPSDHSLILGEDPTWFDYEIEGHMEDRDHPEGEWHVPVYISNPKIIGQYTYSEELDAQGSDPWVAAEEDIAYLDREEEDSFALVPAGYGKVILQYDYEFEGGAKGTHTVDYYIGGERYRLELDYPDGDQCLAGDTLTVIARMRYESCREDGSHWKSYYLTTQQYNLELRLGEVDTDVIDSENTNFQVNAQDPARDKNGDVIEGAYNSWLISVKVQNGADDSWHGWLPVRGFRDTEGGRDYLSDNFVDFDVRDDYTWLSLNRDDADTELGEVLDLEEMVESLTRFWTDQNGDEQSQNITDQAVYRFEDLGDENDRIWMLLPDEDPDTEVPKYQRIRRIRGWNGRLKVVAYLFDKEEGQIAVNEDDEQIILAERDLWFGHAEDYDLQYKLEDGYKGDHFEIYSDDEESVLSPVPDDHLACSEDDLTYDFDMEVIAGFGDPVELPDRFIETVEDTGEIRIRNRELIEWLEEKKPDINWEEDTVDINVDVTQSAFGSEICGTGFSIALSKARAEWQNSHEDRQPDDEWDTREYGEVKVYNSQYPIGQKRPIRVTGISVETIDEDEEQAEYDPRPVVSVEKADENDDDGKPYWILTANRYGRVMATAQFVFMDTPEEEEPETGESHFEIAVNGDEVWIDVRNESEKWQMLPEEKISLESRINRRFFNENTRQMEWDEDHHGLDMIIEVLGSYEEWDDEGNSDWVDIGEDDLADRGIVIERSNDGYDLTISTEEETLDTHLEIRFLACWKDDDGNFVWNEDGYWDWQRAEETRNIHVAENSFIEVELDGWNDMLPVGEPMTITPVLREYSLGHPDGLELIPEDGDRLEYQWENYDEKDVTFEEKDDEPGTFIVTRHQKDHFNGELTVFWHHDDDGDERTDEFGTGWWFNRLAFDTFWAVEGERRDGNIQVFTDDEALGEDGEGYRIDLVLPDDLKEFWMEKNEQSDPGDEPVSILYRYGYWNDGIQDAEWFDDDKWTVVRDAFEFLDDDPESDESTPGFTIVPDVVEGGVLDQLRNDYDTMTLIIEADVLYHDQLIAESRLHIDFRDPWFEIEQMFSKRPGRRYFYQNKQMMVWFEDALHPECPEEGYLADIEYIGSNNGEALRPDHDSENWWIDTILPGEADLTYELKIHVSETEVMPKTWVWQNRTADTIFELLYEGTNGQECPMYLGEVIDLHPQVEGYYYQADDDSNPDNDYDDDHYSTEIVDPDVRPYSIRYVRYDDSIISVTDDGKITALREGETELWIEVEVAWLDDEGHLMVDEHNDFKDPYYFEERLHVMVSTHHGVLVIPDDYSISAGLGDTLYAWDLEEELLQYFKVVSMKDPEGAPSDDAELYLDGGDDMDQVEIDGERRKALAIRRDIELNPAYDWYMYISVDDHHGNWANTEIVVKLHEHELSQVTAVNGSTGHIAYWICDYDGCGKTFLDEEGEEPISADELSDVNEVWRAITALPANPGVSDEAKVKAARDLYDDLDDYLQDIIDETGAYRKLTAAETAVANAKAKAAADQNAANSVIAKINALPANPGVGDEAAVNAARAAYNALSADQKAMVSAAAVSKLTGAETAVSNAKAAAARAAEAERTRAEAAAKFALNVANGSSVPLQVKKSSKNVMVETIADGDRLAGAVSANANIVKASVSGSRVVLKAGKKTGKAKVTVTSAMGGSVTFTVKVQKGKVVTKGVKVPKAKLTMKKGESLNIGAKLNPITAPDKLKFSSASKKIATVSAKGVLKAKKAGKVKITITAGKKKKVLTVTVTN